MTLEATLDDIAGKLKESAFRNEQAISQGVVLRVLGVLDWNVYDTAIVWPEYRTGEGRVDFALCHPSRKPVVFIEVKQPGGAEKGVKQALEYAFHTGVPFIVLTDGATWSFYLPAEQGSYEERRVFKLDLSEHKADESAGVLRRYLERGNVISGDALNDAREEYRSRKRRAATRREIPEAWASLVDKRESSLVDLFAGAVEAKIGDRPDDADIIDFLASLRSPRPTTADCTRDSTDTTPTDDPPPAPPVGSRGGVIRILGEEIEYVHPMDACATVLKRLQERDADFLFDFYRHPRNRGRSRSYVAKTTRELYENTPHLRNYHKPLGGGWLMATYIGKPQQKIILQIAAEVSGLTLGRDIVVDF